MLTLGLLTLAAIIAFAWSAYIMSTSLNRLTASVAALTSVSASAVALVGTLAQEIRDNIGNDDALNALADQLDTDKNSLADAITANTPAASDAPSGGDTPPADTPSPAPAPVGEVPAN